MIKKITQAQTAQDIIEIMHPKLVKEIPVGDLERIAQNIMLAEKHFKGEHFMKPEDMIATRIYSKSLNQITQIDHNRNSYKVTD
jgi:hypothetical protein